MRYRPVIWSALPASAMALFPFMLFKKAAYKEDPIIVNHEKIHFHQQLELLIFPFYALYLLNYLINLIRYRNHHKAYLMISFEREAYINDHNPDYLKSRKPYSWLSFLF